jgi:hypothetical protein
MSRNNVDRLSSLCVAAGFALLAALACRPAYQPGLQGKSESSPSRDSAIAALTDANDSIGLAKVIDEVCSTAEIKSECLEMRLSSPAKQGKVRVAMGALGTLAALHPDIRRNGHVYAHAIGIAAGRERSDVAQTFTQCSEAFQSGCYHGIIQAWFANLDSIGATDANALCAPFRQSESERWIRFQCVHGMGHGLTMLYNHDLPKGLAGCDLLTDGWDRHSCYSGAFMENVVNVTMPHHPASGLAAEHNHSSMAGMGDHGTPGMDHGSVTAFKPMDPDDQLYPCSIMAERYLSACYEMQTSVMLYNNKGSFAGAARGCDSAPMAMRPICYASLGRDVSSYSLQNHAEAMRMCAVGSEKYRPWCYYGLVKNFIDLNARPDDGIALCRDVPTEAGKAVCYNAVGEQVFILASSPEARRAACAPAEPAYLDACLYGARIPVKAPDILLRTWASVR